MRTDMEVRFLALVYDPQQLGLDSRVFDLSLFGQISQFTK
jgi:hypothetical protein